MTTTSDEPVRSAPDLRGDLFAAEAAAQALDPGAFEESGVEAALRLLVPATNRALDGALLVCRGILAACEAALPSCRTGVYPKLRDGRSAVDQAEAEERVADVCFLGSVALAPKRESLERVSRSQDVWDIVAECDSTRRRIIKTLTALEISLAEAERRPSRLAFTSELATSLETRRQYALLRSKITRQELTADVAETIFRRVGTAIAILVGQDIYPLLRIADRRQLQNLQARILDWLRSKKGDSDALQVAHRLHQDLWMFADLIAKVDHRAELVEHDAARRAAERDA